MTELYTIALRRGGRVFLAVSDHLADDAAALALARVTLDQHPAELVAVYRQEIEARNIVAEITPQTEIV